MQNLSMSASIRHAAASTCKRRSTNCSLSGHATVRELCGSRAATRSLFGRGGEEAAALAEAGVEFDVVPGVTSALAGPAYAGIPATDRNLASAVRIYTGQQSRNAQPLTPTSQTSIVLMGVRTLANTVRAMLMAGWPEDTPAAVIEQATTSRQRTTTATLETIVAAAGGGQHSRPRHLHLRQRCRTPRQYRLVREKAALRPPSDGVARRRREPQS